MKILVGIIALFVLLPLGVAAAINVIGGICILVGGLISAIFSKDS